MSPILLQISQQSSQGSDSSQSQNSPPKKRARGNTQVFNLKESITSEQSVSQILKEKYPRYAYSYTNQTKMGAKLYYHCNLSKYHLNPHCGHTIMILKISPTNIQLYENETCHYHHNNATESIGVKEKEYFSENFDKGICTA